MNDIIGVALDSLRKNKLRSFLTVLGIVIGVTTVIGMSAIISGLNSSISSQIQDLGSNLIFVYRFSPVMGRRSPELLSRRELTLEDAEAIAQLPAVQGIAPVLRWFGPQQANSAAAFAVRYRDRLAKNTLIEGVRPDQEQVMNLQLKAGRWINDPDDRHRSNVAVLGNDTAETLFGNLDPIGKEIDVNGRPFRVIGVLEKKKNALNPGSNPDDNVVDMPVGTFWKIHPDFKDFWFTIKPTSQETMIEAIGQVEELLRRRRGLSNDKENDFAIFTQDTFTDLWNQISSGIFAVMLAISSVALIVGGVGVMNIMLVSVTERTKEIGLRKAVGATQRQIMFQFLIEAMVLTLVGGLLGIVVGAGITFAIRTLVPFLPAAMSGFWVSMGLAVSIGTGLVFGLYPAYRASILSPIDALRYE